MAPERHTQESSRSRHSHRGRRDHDDASSVDSGYGGSAANSPKDTHDAQKDALRDYHAESAKHHAESSRRSSRSDEAKETEPKAQRERDSDSDSDYDPRDKYYLKVDDDEYNHMTSATTDPLKEDQNRHITDRDRRDDRRRSDASEKHRSERRQSTASERDRRDRHERRESDASNTSRRSERDRNRDRDRDRDRDRRNSASSRRHSTTSEAGSDSGDRRTRRHSSSRHSDASSTRSDSRDHKESLRRRSDASTASHSRHDSNYRSLSPIPSDSWDESSDESTARSTRRRSGTSRSSRAPRPDAGGSRKLSPDKDDSGSKNRDASARYIDPDGEAAKSFLDKITKGVDMKSVGKVGLDAAAVAAIKIAVGTQVPWKQRIPRTITVGAAAAIMDFIVKKTNFKPKGMIGTIYARQFVEIVLANLIVNPVSSKVTGAAQNAKGKVATGKPGGGGGRGRR